MALVNLWPDIVSYMDDDIRESIHAELAPCTEEAFLRRYLELDLDFTSLLDQFDIDDFSY